MDNNINNFSMLMFDPDDYYIYGQSGTHSSSSINSVSTLLLLHQLLAVPRKSTPYY